MRPRVFLVRHGETDWNAEGRIQSHTDRPLNDTGDRQARELAAAMRALRFDRAIASPMIRARRTAEIILSASVGAPPLEVDDRLVEMDFGPWEGWRDDELAADPVASARRRDGVDIPGVEPESSVEARARSFMAGLDVSLGRTLVVGHGRMLRILVASVVLGTPARAAHAMRMRNCRPAVIEPGPNPLLLGWNLGPADDLQERPG